MIKNIDKKCNLNKILKILLFFCLLEYNKFAFHHSLYVNIVDKILNLNFKDGNHSFYHRNLMKSKLGFKSLATC